MYNRRILQYIKAIEQKTKYTNSIHNTKQHYCVHENEFPGKTELQADIVVYLKMKNLLFATR